jgi:archaellum component FlaF (FlaF/FlaG flagellin family)
VGFSVSIASAIVLVGWIAFISAISTAMLQTINTVGLQVNSTTDDKTRLAVQLQLGITSIENRTINFTVANTGSREIFLRNETYAWNTVLLTYNNTGWITYMIENYTVLSINATGTTGSFNPATHRSIKPGEQALMSIQLPASAPDVLTNSIITVVFATNYGISAQQETFVNQYGLRTVGMVAGLSGPPAGIAVGYVG